MAYYEQAGYGAAGIPHNQHQQFSYASPQNFSVIDHGFAQDPQSRKQKPRTQPQHTGDTSKSNRAGLEHDGNRWQGANVKSSSHRDQYENKEGKKVGKLPIQQRGQQPVDAYATGDSVNQDEHIIESRPHEKDYPQRSERHYQLDDSRRGRQQQSYPQQSSANSPFRQGNESHNRNDSSHAAHGNLCLAQHNDVFMEEDTSYPNQGNSGERWRKHYPNESSESRPRDYNATGLNPNFKELPHALFDRPSKSSSQAETSSQPKSSKRIVEIPMSPDTIAWDNPFPTFPMRPKRGAHPIIKSLDGSTDATNSKGEHHRRPLPHDRDPTSRSESTSYTGLQTYDVSKTTSTQWNHYAGSNDPEAFQPAQPPSYKHVGQDGPRTRGHRPPGGFPNQLKSRVANGRHSEDDRIRSLIPVNADSSSSYERSKTMPIAISEKMKEQNGQLNSTLQTSWQEPGPVAGYYGPDDRGYTPTSPPLAVDHLNRNPYVQEERRIDDLQPCDGHAATPFQSSEHREAHTPKDSLGEVFDTYFDRPIEQDRPPHPGLPQSHYRSIVDEEMPNFKSSVDTRASHRRGLTIDKHLHPHSTPQECSPMAIVSPIGFRVDGKNNARVDEPAPRSRSQPAVSGRRPPIQINDNTFDFGLPRPSMRSPITAPTRGGSDFSRSIPAKLPNRAERTANTEQYAIGPRIPESKEPATCRHTDLNDPPPGSAKSGSLVAYKTTNEASESFHFPPRVDRDTAPSLMAHQDHVYSNGHRSPSPEGALPRHVSMVHSDAQIPATQPRTDKNTSYPIPPTPLYKDRHLRNVPDRPFRDGQIRSPINKFTPDHLTASGLPLSKPSINPDALPAHPVPVRAGLMASSPVSKAAKPTPVRQYNAAPSPMQLSDPSQQVGSSRIAEKEPVSMPVTRQELERLRQIVQRTPTDMATQLVLAKKLVEAANVFVDERADPRTRSKGREKYILEACKIVKKLSANGYTEATFYLADSYTRGSLGIEPDTREAFKLYQTTAKAGHAQAAYRVAVCCEIGQEEGGGTSRDPVKAMQWYKRAATLGDTPAMYKMGIISLKGLLGQPKNAREAVAWLKKAAERADEENPHALHELALLHERPNGIDGVNKDENYSRVLFTQAANLGYKFSQYRLGFAYEYGLIGCLVEPRQSIAWYSKGAVQEEHQSELALSGWYLTGSEGVLQQSDTEAYLWARKAAQSGLAKAEYAMGYFTEVGIGGPANLEDAKRWYWRAASQNFPKARDRLEDLRKGGPTKRKERVSRSTMRKPADGECTIM